MSVNRSSTSVKMVVLVTFVYAVTLYQYYNATVVSTLLRESPKNIRTLEDLLQSNLKAGAENVLYAKDYFKVKLSKAWLPWSYPMVMGWKIVKSDLTS